MKKRFFAGRVFLSFGENCLTHDILKRFSLEAPSTPFSSARSNIEYILYLEKRRFQGFLETENLIYEDLNGKEVVRLKIGRDLENKYDALHMKGFEFTHHDVIKNDEHRDAFERRVDRLLNPKTRSLTIFYFHRVCKQTDWEMLFNHLNELRNIYLKRGIRKVDIILFVQSIIDNETKRKVSHHFIKHIHVYVFHTMAVWGGNNQDVFWARVDNDLIKIMINDVKREIKIKNILNIAFQTLQYKFFDAKIDSLLGIRY